jgi:hypothetical protein
MLPRQWSWALKGYSAGATPNPIPDVYLDGRKGDVVYVERKHMKKKVEGRAIPLHQDAKAALDV